MNNGEAYVATLPGRRIIDPAIVPSGEHVWWSGSGNDFGCTPTAATTSTSRCRSSRRAAGTPVTLTFKSYWDIEWDYDYGFVLATTDSGKTYTSLASANGYTTPAALEPERERLPAAVRQRPHRHERLVRGRHAGGRPASAGQLPRRAFLDDEYDLTAYAGTGRPRSASRYSTDPGLARPGWFIDDLKVNGRRQRSLLVRLRERRRRPGDLQRRLPRATSRRPQRCTAGWRYIDADELAAPTTRTSSRCATAPASTPTAAARTTATPIDFAPGPAARLHGRDHGYGNVGTDNPPTQCRSTRSRSPGSDDAGPQRRGLHRGGRGARSRTSGGPGAVDNYMRSRRTPTAPGTSTSAASASTSSDGRAPSRPGGAGATPEGDVAFTIGSGCGAFDYGNGAVGEGVPPAPPQEYPSQERKPGAAAPACGARGRAAAARRVRHPLRPRRGPLRSVRLACRTLTFRLRKGCSRARPTCSGAAGSYAGSCAAASCAQARVLTVRAPAGGTHLRLRANRKHLTTTITLTLPR